jgi:hypothetical protein
MHGSIAMTFQVDGVRHVNPAVSREIVPTPAFLNAEVGETGRYKWHGQHRHDDSRTHGRGEPLLGQCGKSAGAQFLLAYNAQRSFALG